MIKYIFYKTVFLGFVLFAILSITYYITTLAMVMIWSPSSPFLGDAAIAWSRYIIYIEGIFYRGEWGTVGTYNTPAWEFVADRAKITLFINFSVFFLYVTIGIALGIFSAVKNGSKVEKTISSVTLAYSGLPSFIIVFPLIVILGFRLGWVPYLYPYNATGIDILIGLIIPLLALSGQPIASLTRMVKAELVEGLESEFMLLTKTKGLSKNKALFRHAFRNSIIPVVPQIPPIFAFVLLNSFFVEIFYNVNGLAKLFLDSVYEPMMDFGVFNIDTELVGVIVTFYAIVTLSVSYIADVSLVLIDPRIKLGSKGVRNQAT